MLPVVQEASAAPLPAGWTEIEQEDEDGNPGAYFYNENTKETTWDHPLDEPTRAKLQSARESHRAKQPGSVTDGLGFISASTPDLTQQRWRSDGNDPCMTQKQLLSQPTGGGVPKRVGANEIDCGGELQAARSARAQAEAELTAAVRAREAEGRERQLLTGMVPRN